MPVLIAAVVLIAAELYALVEVARAIGIVPALLLLVVVSACGPMLVRRAGLGVWRHARQRLDHGEVPGGEALDGLVLLAGGVLVCIPGFITDVVGLVLLTPPGRALARAVVGRRLARRAGRMTATVVTARNREPSPPGPVIDVNERPLGPGSP